MTVMERTDTVAHFIGGEEVPSASGRSFASIDPSTGREIAQVAFGEAEDVDRAVAAGRAAFESGAWSKAAPGHRAAVMRRLAELIHQDADRIGAIESRDTGKPLGQAIGEVHLGADFITYFAGHAELPERDHLPRRRRLLRLLGPRAVRRRRCHQPVELPVPARLLEDGAGPRGRQLGRAQDGRADAALDRGAGPPDARGRDAGRRLQRRPRRRTDDRRRARRPSRTCPS